MLKISMKEKTVPACDKILGRGVLSPEMDSIHFEGYDYFVLPEKLRNDLISEVKLWLLGKIEEVAAIKEEAPPENTKEIDIKDLDEKIAG